MPRSLLIRDATVILPTGRAVTNLLVENGVIVSIDAAPSTAASEVIDATGLVLFPGLNDDQVHFREPGLTHKEDLLTVSQACAAGGVTSFLEMPNTKPAAINLSSKINIDWPLPNRSSILGSISEQPQTTSTR